MIKPGDEPIPGYRVEELLGRGQFGQVWRARSPGNTYVALKFLDMDGRHGWKEFRAIQRVKQIRHAHLMPIVAIWLLDENGQVLSDDVIDGIAASQQDSHIALPSMETLVATADEPTTKPSRLIVANLLADKTLGDRLKQCRAQGARGIPVDELLRYMQEVAKGLDFLNSSQHLIGASVGAVQHCDVKPDNIMLTGGSVVICDFGVAQMLAESRRQAKATSFGGTPAYMAPELFMSKPSPHSDQYSLAITYFELRTDDLPFRERTYAAVYEAHKAGDLDFSGVSEAEQQVLRKATATDPEQRYGSCAEFVTALNAAVYPISAPRKAKQLATFALVGLAIAAGAAMARQWWPGGDPKTNPTPVVSTIDVRVVVAPPSASAAIVTINGKPVELDETGRGTFSAVEGETLQIGASAGPDWNEYKATIEADDYKSATPVEIKLTPSARSLAAEAWGLLRDNQFEQAVVRMAEAIRADDSYAQLPSPEVRLTNAGEVTRCAIVPGGERVVAGTGSGDVLVWSVAGDRVGEGKTVLTAGEEIADLAVSQEWAAALPKGKTRIFLARLDGSGDSVELTIPNADSALQIMDLDIADDGRRLVAATELFGFSEQPKHAAIHAWALSGTVRDVADTHELVETFDGELEPHIAAAHRGNWIVLSTMATPNEYCVRKCPLNGAAARELHRQSGQVLAIAVSTDDRLVAVGGGSAYLDESQPLPADGDALGYECRATLIDVAAATQSVATLGFGHEDTIHALSFDAIGGHLATGGMDGDLQLWSIPSSWDATDDITGPFGFLPNESTGLPDGTPVESLVCLPSKWVACLYDDFDNGIVMLTSWQGERVDESALASGEPLTFAAPDERTTTIAATPDGQWLITGYKNGSVRFWPIRELQLIKAARDEAGVHPKSTEPVDPITYYDRSSPPTRRSAAENGEIAFAR